MIKFNEKTCDKIFVAVYIVCFCSVSIYMMYGGGCDGTAVTEEEPKNSDYTQPLENQESIGEPSLTHRINFWQKIVEEFVDNGTKCFPRNGTETEKVEKFQDNEMVIHISILLLQTSLIWTIVDFVDRYLKHGKKKTEKAPLNRTCSLADITLMRHQRRESMRKDYSMELGHGRFPAKSFDHGHNPRRRCSLPVGPGELTLVSTRKESLDISGLLHRRMTITTTDAPIFEHKRSHMRLLHRH